MQSKALRKCKEVPQWVSSSELKFCPFSCPVVSSSALAWWLEQISLMLQTQVSNFKTPSRKSNLSSPGKKIHPYWPPLDSGHFAHIILLTSLILFISLLLHVRRLGLGKLTDIAGNYLSWGLRQVCQTPSSRLAPTSLKLEYTLPFLTQCSPAKKVFSSALHGWRKEKQPRGKVWVNLPLAGAQLQRDRVRLSEAAEKGLPVPNLSACYISCYSKSTGVASPPCRSQHCWAQSRTLQTPEPNTTKGPADSKVHFPVKASRAPRARGHHWSSGTKRGK